jgi:hypothetical protein
MSSFPRGMLQTVCYFTKIASSGLKTIVIFIQCNHNRHHRHRRRRNHDENKDDTSHGT